MLKQLHIKNVAVIDEAEVSFGTGLNVLTGETGAGKSIVIDSINMIMGERGGRELVRHGEKNALIQAVFEANSDEAAETAEEYGADMDDGELVLARKIGENGKSTCRLNAAIVPSAALRDMGTRLIDIHGQHDSQKLLSQAHHIEFLDSFAKKRLDDVKKEYSELYEEYVTLSKKLFELEKKASERDAAIELLSYRVDALEKANVRVGEEDELLAQEKLLSNSEEIIKVLSEVYAVLYDGEFTVYDALSSASKRLCAAADCDAELADDASRLTDILYEVSDIASRVRERRDMPEFDPQRLNEIQERLALISDLKHLYFCEADELAAKLEEQAAELYELTEGAENTDVIRARRDECINKLDEAALRLTKERMEAKKELEGLVEKELRELDMEKVSFAVDMRTLDDFEKNGRDRVEFMISTNPGEGVKPLARIASGGELSRIMLALKVVLADGDTVETLIFDEIDTGVSGRAAGKIAAKLCKIAKRKQVICITHLAQIACAADEHFLIKKDMGEESTHTHIIPLGENERVNELARMVGGITVTDTALAHARDMLTAAKKMKSELE